MVSHSHCPSSNPLAHVPGEGQEEGQRIYSPVSLPIEAFSLGWALGKAPVTCLHDVASALKEAGLCVIQRVEMGSSDAAPRHPPWGREEEPAGDR